MYRISIINNDIESIIHSPYVNDLKLAEGIIKQEINKIDYFNLSFHHNNPAYRKMHPFKTLIKVFNTKKNRYEFEGRVLGPDEDMDSSGLHTFAYDCEGELGYLHDSQQRHMEFRGTPKELMQALLSYHNGQVEEYKRFELGEMNVTNSTDNLYLYLSAEDDTFDAIKDKLVDNLGGELQIRKVNGIRYLDYLEQIGTSKNTEIRIAKNLDSITRTIDPTEIITRLTPLGERVESEDEESTDASEARLTIESVNNGIPYIDREDLIEEFGIQGGSMTWDDITLPENLLTRGQQWINNQKIALYQYKLSATDLFLIGLDPDSFDTGNDYPIYNPIMGIDERLRVIGKSINILKPENDGLTFGDKFKTLDDYQADANKSSRKVVNLERVVNSQSARIGNLLNQMDEVDDEMSNVLKTLADADVEGLPDAISALEQAISNLDDALDGIPIYNPATQTVDGLMSSDDKIKLDSLDNYAEATEVSSGLMSAEDKQKLNRIIVTGNVDLDDILTRLENLEEPEIPEDPEDP